MEQSLGGVDQEPARLAALIARDEAALGVTRGALDAGGSQRGGIGPRGVAVDAHERHRMLGRHAVERGLARESRARPQVLIPVAPADPLAARDARGPLGHVPSRGLLGLGPAEVQRQPHARQVHQMAMGVDQSWQRRAAAEVHDLLAGRRVDVGAAPRVRHAAIAHDQRVDDMAGGAERVNAAVGQKHREEFMPEACRGARQEGP